MISPRGSIVPQEVRYTQPLDTSINVIYAEHKDPAPTWSKLICCKFTNESSANVYMRVLMNFASDTVLSESPNFMGLSSVNTTDELGSVFTRITRIG